LTSCRIRHPIVALLGQSKLPKSYIAGTSRKAVTEINGRFIDRRNGVFLHVAHFITTPSVDALVFDGILLGFPCDGFSKGSRCLASRLGSSCPLKSWSSSVIGLFSCPAVCGLDRATGSVDVRSGIVLSDSAFRIFLRIRDAHAPSCTKLNKLIASWTIN
jgi:hypothetical protein